MFDGFFEAIGWRNTQKYFTKDLELLVEGYAVAIYVDGKVENIEVFVADKLFATYIEQHFDGLDGKNQKDLKLICHSKLIELLISFKEDSSEFENIKNSFYLATRKQCNHTLIQDVKAIIESDNVFADEEKELFERIIKYYRPQP